VYLISYTQRWGYLFCTIGEVQTLFCRTMNKNCYAARLATAGVTANSFKQILNIYILIQSWNKLNQSFAYFAIRSLSLHTYTFLVKENFMAFPHIICARRYCLAHSAPIQYIIICISYIISYLWCAHKNYFRMLERLVGFCVIKTKRRANRLEEVVSPFSSHPKWELIQETKSVTCELIFLLVCLCRNS
jgi:hypothetical protein